MQQDQMLINWFKSKFGLDFSFTYKGWYARFGSNKSYPSNSIWGAACDYASCYDGAMSDKLVEMEGY